ncbi:3-hydroxyacyl-CoA dehydrogenase PaaC [Marinobacter sp. Z-F4-2]|nr:3-hydroxyacyl-CoA dehydrogenase PaaC [Marinobacter sp. Z-F4-2]
MSNPFSERCIGVVGAGTMGAGIAQVAASAGHRVLLFDAAEGAAKKGINNIQSGLEGLVAREKITQDRLTEIVGRISAVSDLKALAPANIVVEAIVEDLEVKQKLFRDLEEICGPGVVLATNTSSISVTAIGAALRRPERLVGMHFFNPAPILKLVEVVSGIATDTEIANQISELAKCWGKHPVHARSTPGFIVNRVARPFYAEALRVLEEGAADVATIDAVMRDCGGFRMGPFELMDLIGLDVNYAVTTSVFDAYYQDPRFLPSIVQKEYVDGGLLGRKSGQGFYDYREGAVKALPTCLSTQSSPLSVTVKGDLGPLEGLVDLLSANGIKVQRTEGDSVIQVGDATLALTDGRSSTQRACEGHYQNLVLVDLCIDFSAPQRLLIAPSDNCSEQALSEAVGLLKTICRDVSQIEDIPGMVMMRTICMLVNEAADAVYLGVCNENDCDTAMRSGVNYPLGPLEWADKLGCLSIVHVLDNLASFYGIDRYRVSPLLRKKALLSQSFLGHSAKDI